ncbi:hypothetical protein LOK49_LG05G02961 [Camellia lanceoleosa]|uniref:Uncharacterized protein n=1 Tax=Camellia lanceoleosa TaxID=1840588 RepID=A0ACC0HNC4_9ERIC|nr:hypothetical protein LOK49_LG05G02961 [Camellia lanceoleosa]
MLRDVKVISEPEESYRLEKFWFSKYGYVNNDEKYFTFSGVNGSLLMWMLTPNGMIHHGANSLAIRPVDFCYGCHQSDNGCVVTKLPECRKRTGLSLPGSPIISRLLGPFTMNWEPNQIGLTLEEVISKIMTNPEVTMAFQNPRGQAAIMDCSQNCLSIAKY